MKVLVLGATGFVGQHLVNELLSRQHQVTAVARGNCSLGEAWLANDRFRFVECDLFAESLPSPRQKFGEADVVIDLAWPGLPNYDAEFHIGTNLPRAYRNLKRLVEEGYRDIVVTGTCYEYGMQFGPLKPSASARPIVAYGIAKDSLRRWLTVLKTEFDFHLRWCRLFYLFGDGQNERSFVPLLKAAIANKDPQFNMSAGEQLRDFLDIRDAASQIAGVTEKVGAEGIYNICSGKPISVRRLADQIATNAKSDIKFNLGHYDYPKHEPLAFWGEPGECGLTE